MRKEYGKLWTVINDSRYCLDVETYLVEDYPEPQDYARQGSTIIKADKLRANGFRGHICWFNCVEAVKAVLGIRKPFIITPYQLYRWLYGRRAYSRGKTQTEGFGEAAERTDCEAAADSTV